MSDQIQDRPLVENSASKSEIRKAKSRLGLAERRRRDKWKAAQEHGPTAAVLWEILDRCGTFSQEDNVIDNANRVLFREGKRNIGLFIVAAMEQASPGAFARLIEHHHKDVTQ